MADKTKLRKVKSKSSAAEKGKQTERLHLPAAAFKRFANDLQKDETTNKFVEINKERVAKFIDRPTELSVSRKREKVEVKDKKSSVPGIYEYKKQDTHTLLELQKVPEFQKALGDRSRFGEGDGSFFDQWLNSNVIQSSYLYDKDGLPLLK